MTEAKARKLAQAMFEAEKELLDQSKLSEADKNIARVMSGKIAEALHGMPETALLSLHSPVQRAIVLRLATELQLAALDAMLDVEEESSPSLPPN